MPNAYRDENESLRAQNHALEEKLAERDREIAKLKAPRAPSSQKLSQLAIAGSVVAMLGVIGLGVKVSHSKPAEPVSLPETIPEPPIPTGDLCATPGVKLTLDGSDAFAPRTHERDLAGHKYTRNAMRSPWFTVNQSADTNPIYVHAVGGLLPGDLGLTSLTLFTIMIKGKAEAYRLAHGGKSMLEVTRSDAKLIAGRFEADVSRVADATREPPFGAAVMRVRGSFCLPALPADPNGTGP